MQKTIVSIDDEADILDALQLWLGDQGYQVITATNAEEGLAKIKEVEPSLVLLDVMMPGKDGFAVLEELKANPKTTNIPVIMLTARGDSKSILRAQEMRVLDYLSKPFDTRELLQLIHRYMS